MSTPNIKITFKGTSEPPKPKGTVPAGTDDATQLITPAVVPPSPVPAPAMPVPPKPGEFTSLFGGAASTPVRSPLPPPVYQPPPLAPAPVFVPPPAPAMPAAPPPMALTPRLDVGRIPEPPSADLIGLAAPVLAPVPSGPSEFTRVVSGGQRSIPAPVAAAPVATPVVATPEATPPQRPVFPLWLILLLNGALLAVIVLILVFVLRK